MIHHANYATESCRSGGRFTRAADPPRGTLPERRANLTAVAAGLGSHLGYNKAYRTRLAPPEPVRDLGCLHAQRVPTEARNGDPSRMTKVRPHDCMLPPRGTCTTRTVTMIAASRGSSVCVRYVWAGRCMTNLA